MLNPLRQLVLIGILGLCSIANNVFALDATGKITNFDPANGTARIFANGQNRNLTIARDVKVLGTDGNPLPGGPKSAELKEGAEVSITVEFQNGVPVLRTIRLGGGQRPGHADEYGGKSTIGFKPLTEMTAGDRYKGEDGGLYGNGQNTPPPAHLKAAGIQTAKIAPLDADGKPSKDGKIGLISISMSNATQEYSLFKQLADKDPRKSAYMNIVDCAQGGQAMAEWVDPAGRAWTETDHRLIQAGLSPRQVQIVWVKLANKTPTGDLAEHVGKLQKDTLATLQNAKTRFPNLRIAYLGSRIYGGYAVSRLNPEPYAYEGAFAVRGLIRSQVKGDAELRYDEESSAKAPLLLWGPYFWADGTTPRRSDNLVWERKDFGGDGTHPSESGRQKVALLLLNFFKNDSLASSWFVAAP